MNEEKKIRESLSQMAKIIEDKAAEQGTSVDDYIVNLIMEIRARQKNPSKGSRTITNTKKANNKIPTIQETEKEKYERKMKIVRERYGLNSFEEVEAELRRMGSFNIGILVQKKSSSKE